MFCGEWSVRSAGTFRRRSAPCTRVTTHVQPVSEDSSEIHRVVLQIAGRILTHKRVDFRRRHGPRQLVQPWRERPRPWPQAWQAKPAAVSGGRSRHGIAIRDRTGRGGQAGGTQRRPTTTACNLHGDLQLSSVFGARESPALLSRIPRRCAAQGEHLARGPVPPPCSPLEASD